MDAQVVYERQPGGDLQHGPCEFVRVGVRFDDRVFWIESAHFPGNNGVEFQRGEAQAKKIVEACTGRVEGGEKEVSRYTPKLEELRTERDERGWWVCDRFGRIDGPYETEFVARSTFHAEAALGHEQ